MSAPAIQGFHTDIVSGSTLTPNSSITAQWTITGINTGFDTCYLAVRPLNDLRSDTAFVAQADPHPQCGSGSAIIVIPEQSLNSTFPFNNLMVIVRLNTPYHIYADSTLFKINETYTAPWDRSEQLAKEANGIAGSSLQVAKGVAEDSHRNYQVGLAGLVIAALSFVLACVALCYEWYNA
ncbi:hypothetical protein BKA64DRAFT_241742 [Cadophora sp. MPI-SDFR-AT-0126]|nr:hypothetical protein BKA64DRAFT_241742 [Leotiomycetes sp. MPI-SDFR-AT-0126]